MLIEPGVKRDFHVHTCFSDGGFRPRDVVRLAAGRKVAEISITDHDSLKGVREGMAAALEHGMRFIPGIELTTLFMPSDRVKFEPPRMIHVLGYGFDLEKAEKDTDFARYLARFQQKKEDFYKRLCVTTREHPFRFIPETGEVFCVTIDYSDVVKEMSAGVISDYHVAMAMKKKLKEKIPKLSMDFRDVLDIFFRQDRSAREWFEKKTGLKLRIPQDVIECFLTNPIDKDKDYYWTEEAVRKVLKFGGVPVLAHPGSFREGVKSVEELDHLLTLGFRGIEVWHSLNQDWVSLLLERARAHGLAATGGSDFHNSMASGKNIGDFDNHGHPSMSDPIEEILARRG